ncbi:hypothetical protein [Saccharothrix deserti]|uniref:hypothetical protein n=1 Tax=Saccharothrix deserti TaxID=2593674 RepID=UPI00131DFE32|nr:hypothetical protein [Saccharothrix deserti]
MVAGVVVAGVVVAGVVVVTGVVVAGVVVVTGVVVAGVVVVARVFVGSGGWVRASLFQPTFHQVNNGVFFRSPGHDHSIVYPSRKETAGQRPW